MRCAACGTPLVATVRAPASAFAWAAGAGLTTAAVAAFLWMELIRAAGRGAASLAYQTRFADRVALAVLLDPAWFIPLGGLAVALAVRTAARARTEGIRWVALGAFAAFVLFGEYLVFERALLDRLVAMHAVEGAASPVVVANDERSRLNFWTYKDIEIDLGWYAAVLAGALLVWRLNRPFRAVVAFAAPAETGSAPPKTAPAEAAPPVASAVPE